MTTLTPPKYAMRYREITEIEMGDAGSFNQGDVDDELTKAQSQSHDEKVGMIGPYVVVKQHEQHGIVYLLMTKDKTPAAYMFVIPNGETTIISQVGVGKKFRNQQLGVQMYDWLMRNVSPIQSDEGQTPGGKSIWQRLFQSPKYRLSIVSLDGTVRPCDTTADFKSAYKNPGDTLKAELRESVSEAWLGHHPGFGNNDQTDILINPSRAEMMKMLRASPYQELRAFLSHNLYVWSGSTFVHHDFPQDLIRPEDRDCLDQRKGATARRCVNLHLDAKGPYMVPANIIWADDDETEPDATFYEGKKLVDGNPVLRRIYGRVDLEIRE